MTAEPVIRTTIELPAAMHQRIGAMAVRERRSGRAQVIWLLQLALDQHDKPRRPAPAASPDPAFDEFRAAYPRKAGKALARRAWDKALRRAEVAAIIDGARRYAEDPNREPEFTAHPATWLNQDRWLDDPLPARRQLTTRACEGDAIVAGYLERISENGERPGHGPALPVRPRGLPG